MYEVQAFIGLLSAVVLLGVLAERWRLSHGVALVLGGLVVGVLPFAPELRISPELIFLVFLPAILYPSALRFAAEDVRSILRPVGFLSIGLVLVTVVVVAAAAHLVVGVAWPAALVLGAILGPTDPVAATSVVRRLGAPGRIATILEGESLVNDGTGLTALKIAIAGVGGGIAAGPAALRFVGIVLGGALVGAVVGWLAVQLRRRLDHAEVQVAVAVLTAYGSFVVAERLQVSGILATVVAGYLVGRRLSDLASAETRMRTLSFWEPLQFLAESILFVLIGLQFGQVLNDAHARPLGGLVVATAVVSVAVIGVRLAWMAIVPYLIGFPAAVSVRSWRPSSTMPFRELMVLGIGGMRGAVSVAAALSIPLTVGRGAPFPERSTLLFASFGAVVVTLVVPALLLPGLVRWLGIGGDEEEDRLERRVRLRIARAALRRADELGDAGELPEPAVDRIREAYELRIAQLRGERAEPERADVAEASREVRRQLVEAERRELQTLAERREVAGEVLRSIERDLDFEEARLAR